MAYRPPFGYNPGLQQGQQQQPIPGQMMQTPQQYPGAGMMPQGYQMPQQGAMVMAPGMYYPNQQMMMPQGFVPAGMMGRGQMPHQQVQQMVHPQQQQQQQQQQPQTEEDKRREEKLKKDRYFQEQKMKLQQFGKGAKPNLSLDMASSLVESLGGPKKPQAQGAKQTQPKPVETDSFGDFQKAGGNLQPVQSEEAEDDFGDFLQARPAAGSTSAHPERTDGSGGSPAVSQQGPAEAPAPTAPEATSDNPVPEKKPEISLEDMMMMSTDLSEATKSAKPIHVKKTLKDVKAHQPSTKSATFLASNRSRTWSSDDNFSSLFTVDTPAAALNVGQGPTAEGVAGGVQQQLQQQPQMSIPDWCANPSSLPLVYQQVYEATFRNGAIQTELLYPILLMSGLDRQALGIIWNMVNKTQPGILVRQELIYALALIALHQNKMPVTLESLFSLTEAPLPTLTPQQSGPTASAPIPSAPHQPAVLSGPDGSSLPSEQAQGTASLQLDSSEPLSSFSQSVAREKEVFNAHFDREEENCYIFTTSPTASSSGHSSPVLWDQNSIYDKLRSRSRESLSSSSVNSDHTVEDPIHLSEFKTHQPDAPPSNSLEEEFAEFQSSRDMHASQKSPPFVSIPTPVAALSFSSTPSSHGPTKSATSPNLHALSESSSDVDLEFGDFSSHRATQQSSTTEAPFGDFQTSTATGGSNDQWATFQHASSEPSLMSSANEDKYAAFKVLEQTSDKDLFGGTVAPVETQVESEDEGGSALRGMVSESDDEEPFSNFQVASIPAEFLNQSAPQGLNISSIPSNMFPSPMNDVTNQEDFGDFVGPKDQKEESVQSGNIVFGDSSLLSSRSSNLPTTLSFPPSANLGVDSFTSFESTLSTGGGDRYEAFKDLQLNGEDQSVRVEDDDFGDFHAVEPSLSSKDTFSLDLENNMNSGISESVGGSLVMSTDLTSDNTLNQSTPKEPSKPPPIHPGLEGPPLLLASESIIGGDRYSEVAGDKVDENRHVTAWERCLKSCHSAIKVANDVLNNISSSSVCKQVTSSSSGSSYFKAIVEVYRVACRVFASIQARGVETDILVKLNDDIEKTWTNLSAFLSSTPLQIDNSSFVFKSATLKPEPENQDKACGVCLLNVDARSKAYNRSEDSLKLSYGGRQYHATCANLWVNMVDSILPALPLEALL